MTAFLFWSLLVNYAAAIFVATSVLQRRKHPTSMLAWIFAILTLPLLGMTLYVLMGADRVRRKAGRRLRRLKLLREKFADWSQKWRGGEMQDAQASLPPDLRDLARLGKRLVALPVTGGNAVTVFTEANATFAAIEKSIRAARDHVHMLYYIWQPDQTGTQFRDLLIEKARTGVKCRVLLDAVGCWALRRPFTQPMVDAGVELAFFLPLWPLRRRWSTHLRNHRKIVVVDGQEAFLGSQNIGDEYRGRLKKLSPWYDTHMRVRGPAALFLQETFVGDWMYATRQEIMADSLFPPPARGGESLVQVLPTGPDQDGSALTQMLFAAVAAARSSLRLETAYFVPDAPLVAALQHACLRGVKVQIVLPTRTDAPLVLWAGRSFYAELLDAGVEIYEYDLGVLHSKLLTVDDRWCVVGSANMDIRSFRLNFEITALVFDPEVSRGLGRWIDGHIAAARRIGPREVWQAPRRQQILEGVARLFSPLL
jgi:cardiolipin synthase